MQRFLNNPRLLLAVTALITAVLVGLSVFPDKFPTFDKVAQLIPGAPTPYVTLAPGEKPLVAAVSERADVGVTVLNQEALDGILTELGVFNKVYNKDVQPDNSPLKKMVIILTTNQQLIEYKDTSGNILFSYAVGFQRDYAAVYINLPGEFSSSYSSMFGAALLYITHDLVDIETTPQDFNEFYSNAGGLFELSTRNQETEPTIPPEIQMLLSPTPTPTPQP